MFLTTKSRYGLSAMYDLALSYGSGLVSLSSIAKRQEVSLNYLEQIFIVLRKEGLINSVRGPKGGYRLSREPKDINVGEILKPLEKSLVAGECEKYGESTDEICELFHSCPARGVWNKITEAIEEVLTNTSLQDMINDHYFVEKIGIIKKDEKKA